MERFVKFASIFEPFIGPILDKSVLLSIFVKLEGLNLALCLSNRGVDVENDKLESLKRSFSLSNHTMNERNVKQGLTIESSQDLPESSQDCNITSS